MPDLLVRGLSEQSIKTYDAEAALRHTSRNDVIVQRLEVPAPTRQPVELTDKHWQAFADAYPDLADDEYTDSAWR